MSNTNEIKHKTSCSADISISQRVTRDIENQRVDMVRLPITLACVALFCLIVTIAPHTPVFHVYSLSLAAAIACLGWAWDIKNSAIIIN